MKRVSTRAVAVCLLPCAALAANPFVGRWDLTFKAADGTFPNWLEVVDNSGNMQARYQPHGGSVRPFKGVRLDGDHLILTIAPGGTQSPTIRQFIKGIVSPNIWDLTVKGDLIAGVEKMGASEIAQLSGVRAPKLDRKMPKEWTKAEVIFNGKDLTGWAPDKPSRNHWVAKEGELANEARSANLLSTRKFDDFKLHIELNCPRECNSGIYLRGRYEMNVEYEGTPEDAYHGMGSIYGMVPVSQVLPRTPGEWERFDITLVGRRVTIVRNGVKIIDNQEIAGITGGALDANEGEPGVFYLQGDHPGAIKFRNITVSVPKQ